MNSSVSSLNHKPSLFKQIQAEIGALKKGKVEKLTLIFIDGLGTTPLNINAKKEVYETVFPPSTVPFFYSFFSQLLPGEHAFLEWFACIDGEITIPITWTDVYGKAVEPHIEHLPASLMTRLEEAGISTAYLSPFIDSAFSAWASEGSEKRKMSSLEDIFPLPKADFTFIYWPNVDTLKHEGKDKELQEELLGISGTLKRIQKEKGKDERILVLSTTAK